MNSFEVEKITKDELYETDLAYKVLVDNYIRASIENNNPKKRNDETSKRHTESINALAKYTDALRHKELLKLLKAVAFTTEDLAEMYEKRIISVEILSKMIKFKVGDEDE
nr:MAG TPA: hypothetical protein [Caudoviricetes sp.]